MTTFTTLSQAIQTKLESLQLLTGVVMIQEDSGDVPSQIEKEVGRVGMGALLGTPGFDNDDPYCDDINANIKLQILFMEVPAMWRTDNTKPHCPDAGQAAAVGLQGLEVPGYEPLRVLRGEPVVEKETGNMNLYRLEIETMQVFDAS